MKKFARVDVSAEDPKFPIESASRTGIVWIGAPAKKVSRRFRLLFDGPKDIRRIWLGRSEPKVERTQQFTLRWADSQTGPFREIVLQQLNFNPRNSTTEVEDYKVDLHHVLAMELIIDPDEVRTRQSRHWRIADWRIAGMVQLGSHSSSVTR